MSEWIKCSEREPEYRVRVLAWNSAMSDEVIAFREGVCWFDQNGLSQVPVVTHWQPLPAPPKREDGFESWWQQQRECLIGLDMRRFFHDYITKGSAKLIWDAAIAASKSDDFVP